MIQDIVVHLPRKPALVILKGICRLGFDPGTDTFQPYSAGEPAWIHALWLRQHRQALAEELALDASRLLPSLPAIEMEFLGWLDEEQETGGPMYGFPTAHIEELICATLLEPLTPRPRKMIGIRERLLGARRHG